MATPGSSTGGQKTFVIHDRRSDQEDEKEIVVSRGTTYRVFRDKIKREFNVAQDVKFVVATLEDKHHVSDAIFGSLDDGTDLLLLDNMNQEISAPVKSTIRYQPHYDTILKSGLYEYYTSEGKSPLTYALAELIDNSLSATRSTHGKRKIEIRLYVHGLPKDWMVCVMDNGKGMTKEELNDWAVMRLSKFHEQRRARQTGGAEALENPLFLNSDISFFGAGGKQAIFCLGEKVRMVSKPSSSAMVCELSVSKDEFKRREKEGREIYEADVYHREPGNLKDTSRKSSEDVKRLALDEIDQKSFTQVVITDLRVDTNRQLKMNKKGYINIAKELANVYYYYIHGYDGGHGTVSGEDIDITVSEYKDGQVKRSVNLRDVEDDMESKFVQTARGEPYEFQVKVPIKLDRVDLEDQPVGKKEGVVKGILRYHPHDFDGETFPSHSESHEQSDDDAETSGNVVQSVTAKGNKDIFKCFWNGRLIPYTTVKDLPWCTPLSRKGGSPLVECYERVSGVLFLNDVFKVSTNKLTFMDLDAKLNPPNKITSKVFYEKMVNGEARRMSLENMKIDFRQWLVNCHRDHDKQIKFCERLKTVRLGNKHKRTTYRLVERGRKKFRTGELVRTQGTNPIYYGKIKALYLAGDYAGDTFQSTGSFEIALEPDLAYQGERKDFPLRQLDHMASSEEVQKGLRDEEKRLPKDLVYQWTGENGMKSQTDGSFTIATGQKIGDVHVRIKSREGTNISKIAGIGKTQRRLGVRHQIVFHGETDFHVLHPEDNMAYLPDWGYYFHSVVNATNLLGRHTLKFQAVVKSEGGSARVIDDVPAIDIPFTVTVGQADNFKVDEITEPCKVGVPFSLKITIHDKFGNTVDPQRNLKATVNGNVDNLTIDYGETTTDGQTLLLNDVILVGPLDNKKRKVKLEACISQLLKTTKSFRVDLLPGLPDAIALPDETSGGYSVENGATFEWKLEITDLGGNVLPSDSNIEIECEFPKKSKLPPCHGTYQSGKPCLKVANLFITDIKSDPVTVEAKVFLPNYANVSPVVVKIIVNPRRGPSKIKVYREQDVEGSRGRAEIMNGDKIVCRAGEQLGNLIFELIDEGGHIIGLSSGKDQLAKGMSCSWASKRQWPVKMIRTGKLPIIKLPENIDSTEDL